MPDLASQITIRQELRFSVIRPTSISIDVKRVNDTTADLQGTVNDISIMGMRLVLNSRVEIGAEIEIEMIVDELGIKDSYSGTVRWSQPRDGKSWWIGCSLQNSIPEKILNNLAAQGILDRRQDDRRPVSFQATANWQLNTKPSEVTIKNYSVGGCCIEINGSVNQLNERLLLVVEDVNSKAHTSIRIPLRVMWSNESDGRMLVGCSFLTRHGYLKLKNLIEHDATLSKIDSIFVAQTRWRWIAITAFVLLAVQTINMAKRQVYLSEPFERGLKKVTAILGLKENETQNPPAERSDSQWQTTSDSADESEV